MKQALKILKTTRRLKLLTQKPTLSSIKHSKPFLLQDPKSPTPHFSSSSSLSPSPNPYNSLVGLFGKTCPCDPKLKNELIIKVLELKDELLKLNDDFNGVYKVLDEKGLPLFASYYDGSALVELLHQLNEFPNLAVEVFNWRRKHESFGFPITSEEYAKGIRVAGRARNVDLASELFTEAANNRVKTSSTYNALMSVYMSNGMSERCQSLFREFKREENCSPTIVTYNILVSVFGRLMLVDHMEATLQQIFDSNLSPSVNTFNNLIAGYVTAWMWDRMENTFRLMKQNSIEPDAKTYLLMLRGYSHAGKLRKMEAMYELVKGGLDGNDFHILRCMICAYCKSSAANRIERIEELMKLIPEEQYCSWLNVLLIRVYAQELQLDIMEKFIDDALERDTAIRTSGVMRSIITAYYRSNAVDKLSGFVKRAEYAGWRICRSLYHCKMVMYGSQNRVEEMENVLTEMNQFNMSITKKTMLILYKAYSNCGPRCKLEQVVGMMCKHGYGIPLNGHPS